MSPRVKEVIDRLEGRSQMEKKSQNKIRENEAMLAITYDSGKFLSLLTKLINAKRILEIGTSSGYSALWFADSLFNSYYNHHDASEKLLITIDNDSNKIDWAKINFDDAGLGDKIHAVHGSAIEVLRELQNNSLNSIVSHKIHSEEKLLFDIILLDADKENLIEYFDIGLTILRAGGVIVTDNIIYPEEFRSVMDRFLKHIKDKKNIQSTTLTIGNGLELSMKLT